MGENRGPDIGVKTLPAPPFAAIHGKSSFEVRDAALDPGPEVSELFVDPRAFDHVADLDAPFFMESAVLDPICFDSPEV